MFKSEYTFGKMISLFLVAMLVVHAIYNPHGISLYDWIQEIVVTRNFRSNEFYICGMLSCLILGLGYFYFQTALKGSLIGKFLTILFLVFLIRFVVYNFKLDIHNKSVASYLVTVPISIFLGWGMNTAHLTSRMSGRVPTN